MTDTILSTTLGGALQRRPDGWYWRDGTPEPRVRDMLLNDIAPNFRVMGSAVEIPHDWRAPRHWPQGRVDNDAAEAIGRLVSDLGKPGPIYADGLAETLDEPASRVQGYTLPIAHWDAAMREPCGTWWDREHEADILAMAARLNEGKAALLRRSGLALWGDNWRGDMARALKVRRDSVDGWSSGKTDVPDGVMADLAKLVTERRKHLDDLLPTAPPANDNRAEVIRAALASFGDDPPDTRYQLGYLDALLDIAVRQCGIAESDPVVRQARTISDDAHDPPPEPPRARGVGREIRRRRMSRDPDILRLPAVNGGPAVEYRRTDEGGYERRALMWRGHDPEWEPVETTDIARQIEMRTPFGAWIMAGVTEQIGRALWGEVWHLPMATALGVDKRVVQDIQRGKTTLRRASLDTLTDLLHGRDTAISDALDAIHSLPALPQDARQTYRRM